MFSRKTNLYLFYFQDSRVSEVKMIIKLKGPNHKSEFYLYT